MCTTYKKFLQKVALIDWCSPPTLAVFRLYIVVWTNLIINLRLLQKDSNTKIHVYIIYTIKCFMGKKYTLFFFNWKHIHIFVISNTSQFTHKNIWTAQQSFHCSQGPLKHQCTFKKKSNNKREFHSQTNVTSPKFTQSGYKVNNWMV